MQAALTRSDEAYGLRSNDLRIGDGVTPYRLSDPGVSDLPGEDRPRERLMRLGPGELSLAELVAVLLGVGTQKEEVLKMARRIVREYGERSIATEKNPRKMAEALNVPITKTCQIIAAFEIGRRFYASRGGKAIYIRTANQAYDYLQAMGYSTKEQLKGLYLNSRYQIVHDELISVGSLTASIVHPREVFRPAIEHGAVAIIIAHNHPSGSTKPTDEDIIVTDQLRRAGQVLGIELLDHLVITAQSFARIKES